MTQNTATAYRAAILDSLGDPAEIGLTDSIRYFEDGLMLVENGKITALGDASRSEEHTSELQSPM